MAVANGDLQTGSNTQDPPREKWNSRAEFLLSCIGLSVGIGNVWRFPYKAYENGGGAFFLPYVILLILVGKPMYFLELALGQYCALGPMKVWKCCPVFVGVGAAMVVVSIIVAIYYTVIISYTVFYMCASFYSMVPWAECMDWWGADERCFVRHSNNTGNFTVTNATNSTPQTPSEQFWKKYVLHIDESGGIGDIGGIRWDLALCLLFTWIIVFFCLFKGIKSSGKVVYFTATFPYVILIILFIRGVTLDGAGVGISYFFTPQWDKLLEIKTWFAAADQMFYSLGIAWGSLIMFGSYNDFRNRVHIDALIVSSMDFLTSVIAGVVIFSVLGAMAQELNIDVSKVIEKGPGLAFVVYPEALARLPVPQLWSVLFFFMLFTLGLDSEFATVETVLTVIYDKYPKSRNYKPWIVFAACSSMFILGLPCVTNGGQYVLEIMDWYGGGFSILFIGAFEMIALAWVYGVNRIADNLEYMLGSRPNLYWRICWAFCSPAFLIFIIIYFCIDFKAPTYGDYVYPVWGHIIGWALLVLAIIQIPIFAGITIYKSWRSGDIKAAFRPRASWMPNDGTSTEKGNGSISVPAVGWKVDLGNGNGQYVYNISSAL